MAQEHILAASAAVTADATKTGVLLPGFWRRMMVVFDVTATLTNAGDKIDAYVDLSPDGVKYLNAIHFTQVLGTTGAKSEIAILDQSNPGTAAVATTSDCTSGVVRPSVFGKYARARFDVTDGGGGVQSFTCSVKAYTQ